MGAVRAVVIAPVGTLQAGRVLSAKSERLQELVCTNTGAAVAYCQIFDSATVPADTAVPKIVFAVQAEASASYDNAQGLTFVNGISVCVSSTAHVKTVKAAEAVFFALVEA